MHTGQTSSGLENSCILLSPSAPSIGASAGGGGTFDEEGVARADEDGVEVRDAEEGAAPPRFEPRKKRGFGAAI